MTKEFHHDDKQNDLRLLEIAGEQFRAFNYETRSFFSDRKWSGWSQERLEQYFLEYELPPEHAAKYSALKSLVEARDIDATLTFIAENGGTQVEGFWFIAYWQIILATVGTTPAAIALRKRIPWSAPEKITVTLTERELQMAINAVLDACKTCLNEQFKNVGEVGTEKEYQHHERRQEAYWSLQSKLRAHLPQSSSAVNAT